VDYAAQQQYLRASRICSAVIAVLVIAVAAPPLLASFLPLRYRLYYALPVLALAISIFYTPDYLHLGVNPQKAIRWAIKIRWRIVAGVLVLGCVYARDLWGAGWWPIIGALVETAWLALFNAVALFFARRTKADAGKYGFILAWLWVGDYLAITWIFLVGSPLFPIPLFALSCHLAVVSQRRKVPLAALVFTLGACWDVLQLFIFRSHDMVIPADREGFFWTVVLVLWTPFVALSAFGTAFLVARAQKQNRINVSAATAELVQFTGYSAANIRELWATSDRKLAENWQTAGLSNSTSDPERLAAWYRDNSELYLFAISGYNLDYKRIRSNLGVLRYARGRCLDYGAGNGELILELARRGHPAAYYDVEGRTMRFARSRAQQHGLALQFFTKKDDLGAAPGFDTIFSFDVLEHLPDLGGELTFLSSLLNRGGLFVFDIPAGATSNHPMHLNHQLDFIAHLRARGLERVLTWRDRLPFRKEEKYVFRRPE
jgi:SAM-dependent methyltransferase